MTPHLWLIISFIAGLALGLTVDRYEVTKLSEPLDGIRFYPLALTDRLTGEVTVCHVTKDLSYSCR